MAKVAPADDPDSGDVGADVMPTLPPTNAAGVGDGGTSDDGAGALQSDRLPPPKPEDELITPSIHPQGMSEHRPMKRKELEDLARRVVDYEDPATLTNPLRFNHERVKKAAVDWLAAATYEDFRKGGTWINAANCFFIACELEAEKNGIALGSGAARSAIFAKCPAWMSTHNESGAPGWSRAVGFTGKAEGSFENVQLPGWKSPGTVYWARPLGMHFGWDEAKAWAQSQRPPSPANDSDTISPTVIASPDEHELKKRDQADRGRLLTLNEMRELLKQKGSISQGDDDQWCATATPGSDFAKDFVCVGDYFNHPGKAHFEMYGMPPWSETPNIVYPDGQMCRWNVMTLWTFEPSAAAGVRRLAVDMDQEANSAHETLDEYSRAKDDNDLDKLRAKAMYNLVEEIEVEGVEKKLLFLTNAQAELITRTPGSIKRLLEAFEMPEPRLVINLLYSQGTIADMLGQCDSGFVKNREYYGDGRVRNVHPWLSHEEALRAEKKLDSFMSQVLVPIAAENNAVVVCDCLKGGCFLSSSFHRVMALQAGKWVGKPPITVLSFSADLHALYRNPDLLASWRTLKNKSKHWRKREVDDLLPLIHDDDFWSEYGRADLDGAGHNYIIVDGIHPTRRTWEDRRAFNKLKVEVVRHLMMPVSQGGKGLPSIAVKTGFSKRGGLEDAGKSSSSLAFAIDCLESGQNLLFLDMRERLPAEADRDMDRGELKRGELKRGELKRAASKAGWPSMDSIKEAKGGGSPVRVGRGDLESDGKADIETRKDATDADGEPMVRERPGRGALIDKAKRAHDEACDKLILAGTADIFDVMAAAYFHSVLRGNGEESISSRDFTFLPLCDAIEIERRRLKGGQGKLNKREDESLSGAADVMAPPATIQQIEDLAWWLSKRLINDMFEMFHKYHFPKRTDFILRDMGVKAGLHEAEQKQRLRQAYFNQNLDGKMSAMASHLTKLFSSSCFHGANINDLQNAGRLVKTLVKQDRLPPTTPLEGLELLHNAWCEHDVAIHLAHKYKRLSVFLYTLYLLIGLAIVVFTTLHGALPELLNAVNRTSVASDIMLGVGTFPHIIFGLSLAGAFCLSITAYYNPTQRAATLSSAAASLESITWQYRARVGAFQRGENSYSKASENALCRALANWRENLVAGTDLESTAMKQRYPPKVYKHYQQANYAIALLNKQRRTAERQATLLAELQQGMQQLQAKRGSSMLREHKATAWDEQTRVTHGRLSDRMCDARQQLDDSAIVENRKVEQDIENQRNAMADFSCTAQILDDFQSPINYGPYIALRLLPAILDYQTKIPSSARWKTIWQMLTFVCTTAGAVLAYSGQSQYVAIISATATAISSWMAFERLQERLQRYTTTVRSLENLLSWWASLNDISKAAEPNITRLVQDGERIVTSERLAWSAVNTEYADDDKGAPGSAGQNMANAQKGGGASQAGGGSNVT